MNTLLLFFILLTQLSVAFMFRALLTLIRDKPDFSKEDASVIAATDRSKEATDQINAAFKQIPPQKQ